MKRSLLMSGLILASIQGIFAQPTYEVTASFSPSYRFFELSAYAKLHLFLQEKGDVNFELSPMGRFVKLSPNDAERFGHEHIVLIPLNDMERFDLSLNDDFDGKPVKLRVHRLGDDSQVYYTKDAAYFLEHLRKDYMHDEIPFTDAVLDFIDPLVAVLADPSSSDTLERASLYDYGRLRYTKRFIELLDNDREVMVHSVNHFHYLKPDGGEDTDYEDSYETMKLAELARYRLGKIHHHVEKLPTPDKDAPKTAWETWYGEWCGQYPSEKEGNTLLDVPVVDKKIGDVHYGVRWLTDTAGKAIYDFRTQTRITSSRNELGAFRIREPKIEIGSSPLGGYIAGDTAYIVGTPYRKDAMGNAYDRFLWGEFTVVDGDFTARYGYLNDAAHELLRQHLVMDNYLDFKRVFSSHEVMFIHLKERKSADETDPSYFLLALETRTGKPLGMVEINRALQDAGLEVVEPYFLGMANVDEAGNLLFSARVEGKPDVYLLKFDRNLQLASHAAFAGIPDRIFPYQGQYRLVRLRKQSLDMVVVDDDLVFQHSKRFELPDQQFDSNEKAACQLRDGRLAVMAKNNVTLYEELSLVVADPTTGQSTISAVDQRIRMEDAEAQYAHIVGLEYLDGYLYPSWIRNKRLHMVKVALNE